MTFKWLITCQLGHNLSGVSLNQHRSHGPIFIYDRNLRLMRIEFFGGGILIREETLKRSQYV